MTTAATTAKTTRATRSNAAWGSKVPPRPIRNKAEHKAALDEVMRISRLVEVGKATRSQSDASDVLAALVQQYEERRFGSPPCGTPLERLQYVIEQSGLSESDLGRLLGDRALGHRVLTGERELSKSHIRKLADHFKINPGYFI